MTSHPLVSFMSALVIVAGVSVSVCSGQAQDVAIGTWKLDVNRSNYGEGPRPLSQIVVVAATGNGVSVTIDTVEASGRRSVDRYTAMYDGKDYPYKGIGGTDSVSLRRIDQFSVERVDKRRGVIVQIQRRTISSDGRVMTVTRDATGRRGRALSSVAVYTRQ